MEPCNKCTPIDVKIYGSVFCIPKGGRKMIKLTLKDGSIKEVEQGSTIYEVAKEISEGLARVATCGIVNGEVKDLRYELQEDCNLSIETFDSSLDGQKAYWHGNRMPGQ